MMQCSGCYAKIKADFCLKCRKKLFDGKNVSSKLSFEAPKEANFAEFQQHTKRLSISGVQLKYSLHLKGSQLVLTESASQYLIKPIPEQQLAALDDVPENEHLTMQIAEQIFKIRTAPNELVHFSDGQQVYITRRFDVMPGGSKYQQEDFAQLLSRTSETHGQNYKYDGTYEEIGALVKKYVAAAAPALEELFKLILFNYIVGNGDAHLKNFSLMRVETGEYRLTPAYELMSTKLHTPYESDTALELYENCMEAPFYGAYGYYGRPDFIEFAKRLGLVDQRVNGILQKYIASEKQLTTMVESSHLSTKSKAIYIKIVQDRLYRIGELR